MNLLIVESPAKCKTLKKYLGSDYEVLASFGHIRDLPSKTGSVIPEKDFEVIYEADSGSEKHIKPIVAAVKKASKLILATDPDREGEAISWHVLEELKKRRCLPKDIKVERVAFNEITKSAVQKAVANPREIDMDLVNAQQARRALDYLVGFSLSPVLWRKLPGSRSAGRVQSVALRLITEREGEIEKFIPQEFWDINLDFYKKNKEPIKATLVQIDGKKLDKFALPNEKLTTAVVEKLNDKTYKISDLKQKDVKRNPFPPFNTASLQQAGANRLSFGAKRTMQIAQKLYEGIEVDGQTSGLITYMRTDGINISNDAIPLIREHIKSEYGEKYLPDSPRIYKSKVKNAQEAHEAIRPTNFAFTPAKVKAFLSDEQFKLYQVIWRQTICSQMASAILKQTTIEISATDNYAMARASGSIVGFDGFYKLHKADKEQQDNLLPQVVVNEELDLDKVTPNQHFTEPLPRYSEASLVKKLEELGIGRPSTYASIISLLVDRGYTKLETRRFFPEERGRIVSAFLENFFAKYVEYDFTANLEEQLDDVSNGKLTWKGFLKNFWVDFDKQVASVLTEENATVVDRISEFLAYHYFPAKEDGTDPRKCPDCSAGKLSLKTGKFGAFIACSNYPECKYTRQIADGGEQGEDAGQKIEDKVLGQDGEDEILLKKGPYGFYVQRGAENKGKPARMSIPKQINIEDVNLETALTLVNLPRIVGVHPETKKEIKASYGKFGPYLLHDGKYTSVKEDDILTIGINRAVTLISENKKAGGSAKILKDLGELSGDKLTIQDGRYGAYIKHGKKNYALPKGAEADSIDLAKAKEIIAAKGKK
jgi:DNA topoisomerase-1